MTDALRTDANVLEIRVTNLFINRMIGDEQLPSDCERDIQGTVTAWPKWVLDQTKSPSGRFTFATQRQWTADDPLVQSGLLGPVSIRTALHLWS